MKVSIIVAVYGVEKYLDKCLESLVNQTLKDIEIIVVNDESPDGSQVIIDKYEKKYKNLKGYKKKNGGLSDARNYGINIAQGEYIAIVDGDDYIELDMYELMYNKAVKNNFDMVVCDVNYVYHNKTEYASSQVPRDVFGKEAMKRQMINIYPAAWNKLYHKRLFEHDVRFKKGVWFEDVEFLYRLLPYVGSIGVVNKALVNYVQRDGSIMKTFDDRLFHHIDNWNGILNYYQEHGLYDEYKTELEYCYVRYLYATFMNAASNYSDKKMFSEAFAAATSNVKERFPHYRKNKYFYESLKGIYLILFCRPLVEVVLAIKKRKLSN